MAVDSGQLSRDTAFQAVRAGGYVEKSCKASLSLFDGPTHGLSSTLRLSPRLRPEGKTRATKQPVALMTLFIIAALGMPLKAAPYQDRFVWVFGWNLSRDSDVDAINRVLEDGAKHGINGAVLSAGMDSMTRQSPAYFRRLDTVRQTCDRLHIELIPAGFSVGYGSSALGVDKMLAEGVSVENAPFIVRGNAARLMSEDSEQIANGDFEQFKNNRFNGLAMQDQPGQVSFADTEIHHGGKASIRVENFTANPYGHGRIMENIRVHPHRCYRMTIWVKTEGLQPPGAFRVTALADGRDLAPREFRIPATQDWRKITMLVNSLDKESINVYAGVWGAKQGKFWLDDWSLQEIGPINVLRRPGTPVGVKSEDGATTYDEGKDFAPLVDPNFNFNFVDRAAVPLRILPSGRIKDGQRLKVSWYHPMVVNDGQVTVCMAEPELYEIFDREAKALAEHLHPKRVLLNMDEIRMGGTCEACRGRDLGELLGQCITKQVQILRKYMPDAQVCIWSDMLDPNHNAHGNYYLVQGSFAGSWNHVPKDLVIAIWGGTPREKSVRIFAEQGFGELIACYYDADNLEDVRGWMRLAKDRTNVRGFMYTPWQKKYQLLGAFGDLIQQ
jgi:hypothetical protein